GRGRVVAAGRGGDVRRGVLDRHIDVGGSRQGQREGRVDRPGVALGHRGVTNAHRRRVVGRPGAVVEQNRNSAGEDSRQRRVGATVGVEVVHGEGSWIGPFGPYGRGDRQPETPIAVAQENGQATNISAIRH